MTPGADLAELIASEALPGGFEALVESLHAPLARRLTALATAASGPVVVGLTGPQGSGKTTAGKVLALLVARQGVNVAVLALDDFYLTLAERLRLAREVHPLLKTRGPPGTHDPRLAASTIAALAGPGPTPAPRFDKGADDRMQRSAWPLIEGPVDLVLFEGWCVGARPQPPSALAAPVNELERAEDPRCIWRTFVNDALAGPYQPLFTPIAFQILFCAPTFETVFEWRAEQERKLRARRPGAGQTDAEIARFVQHYERLTRHIAAEMPSRADVVVRLAPDRSVQAIEWREAPYSTMAE